MYQVLTCLSVHDLRLVAVAGMICAVGCFSAIRLFQRCRRAQNRGGWLALTAAVAGAGVWATHFVGVLAFQPGMPMAFALGGTILSLISPIVGLAFGFAVALGGPVRRALGGAIVGLSFSGMHFTGILSVEMQARLDWQAAYVAAAILLSVLLSSASLVVLGRGDKTRQAAAAALLMLAILSLHFTAMTALTVTPDPAVVLDGAVSRLGLAAMVTLVALLVVVTPYFLLRIEQRTEHRTLSTLKRSIDAMPSAMAFFDSRDRLVAWNAAYAELLAGVGIDVRDGLAREVMLRGARNVEWGAEGAEDEDAVLERLRSWREEDTIVRTKSDRWLRHRQIGLEGGGRVVTFTDVTNERELFSALTTAKDSAEAASAAKTAFLANISHEIRTPLNGLLGAAELLSQRPLAAPERDLVDMMQASGRMLNDLLSDLLDLSRLGAGAIELHPRPTEVSALVAEAHRLFAASARIKRLDLQCRVEDSAVGWVVCDATRLLQVLGNLLGNAIKFTDAGGVTLTVRREQEKLIFSVADTGVGFESGQKDRLFQRFIQADASATRAHGGAGLGLAIAKELVELMGGEIDAMGAPGVGATFFVTLPLPSIAAGDPATGEPSAASLVGEGRVLIVDDNETNRRVLSTILAAVGIDYAEARDGAEAVEAFSRELFGAVLMDLQMPVMDGLEATRRIREMEAAADRPRTPLFVVSASCLEEHVAASRAAGADEHFGKPVSAPQLLRALALRLDSNLVGA